jgi:hypothetical protein
MQVRLWNHYFKVRGHGPRRDNACTVFGMEARSDRPVRIGHLADGFGEPDFADALRFKFSLASLSGVSRQSKTLVFHSGPSTFLTSCAAFLRETAAAQY